MKEIGVNSATEILQDLKNSYDRYEMYQRLNRYYFLVDSAVSVAFVAIGTVLVFLVHPLAFVVIGYLFITAGLVLFFIVLERFRKRRKDIYEMWLEQYW